MDKDKYKLILEENRQLKKQLKRLEESYEKLSNEYSDYVHTTETEEVAYL